MPATPTLGFSTTLSVDDNASAQAPFSSTVTITLPIGDTSAVDTSNLLTANMIRTFIAGFTDPGSLSFSIQYNKADYTRLLVAKGVPHTWQVVIPTDGTADAAVSIPGFLSKADLDISNNEIMQVKCEVKITGGITVA